MRTAAVRIGVPALSLLLALAPAAAATPEEEAVEHYTRGTTAFNLAHYDEAITEYEVAYRLKEDPRYLFNIAQSHRLAHHFDLAIRFYRNYLRLTPDSPLRAAIEERIAELEKAVATTPTEPPPTLDKWELGVENRQDAADARKIPLLWRPRRRGRSRSPTTRAALDPRAEDWTPSLNFAAEGDSLGCKKAHADAHLSRLRRD